MGLRMVLFVAMAVVPALVGAKDFIVGDDEGWKLGVNYTEWAEGKEFKVGDKLVFNYNKEKHSVLKVDGAAFKSCNKTSNIEPLTTGKDVIDLASSGRKWYICAVADHCAKGMKLLVTVEEAEAPAPSPTGGDGNSAITIASFGYTYLVGLIAVLAMVIVF